MFGWIKKIFKKADDVRETIEDRIAAILDKIQGSEKVDEIEKKLIAQGVQVGAAYFTGTCPLTNEQLNHIAEVIVSKGINNINSAISKQLRKR